MHIHKNDIKLLDLDSVESLLAIVGDGDDVVVLLEDLHSQPLVDGIVLGQEDIKRFGVVRERRRCTVLQRRDHAIAEVD